MKATIKVWLLCLLACGAARAAWEKTATITSGDYWSLAAHKGTVFFGMSNGVITSKDMGKTWDANTKVYGAKVWRMLSSGDTLYAATADKGLVFTLDLGKTWQEPAKGPGHEEVRWVDKYQDVLYLASQKSGIWRSKDAGRNWESINTGLPSLQAYAVAGGGGKLFAATAGATGKGVYRSNDYGAHWETPANASFNGAGCFYLVCDGQNLLAGPNHHFGVIRSPDWGETWDTDITTQGSSQPPFVHSLEIYGINGMTASPNNGGVNFTKDGGKTWLWLNKDVTPKVERPHYMGVAAGYVMAGSAGYGIWRLPLAETPMAPLTTGLRPRMARLEIDGGGKLRYFDAAGRALQGLIPAGSDVATRFRPLFSTPE
jgi:photosystem II stability/assembly factor-like uncharacterized protein